MPRKLLDNEQRYDRLFSQALKPPLITPYITLETCCQADRGINAASYYLFQTLHGLVEIVGLKLAIIDGL